jgi:hypothetical protein
VKFMKKILLLIAILILSTSCDSPRSARSILTKSVGSSNGVTTGATTSGVDLGTSSTTTTAAVAASNIPADATQCKFSTDGINGFESVSSHLGSYTLCQSSTDKNVFYAQFKTPPVGSSGDVSVCFIPHTTSGSNSIYVGNPMCGTFTDPKSVKKITFVKYASYSSALINNVMFFKDTSYYYPAPFNSTQMTLDAYKICMAQLSYGNSSYCQALKSVGQYVMKTF